MGGSESRRASNVPMRVLGRHFTRVTTALAAAALLLVGLGPGSAWAADPLIGKRYAEAASSIARWNGTPVVATVSGSQRALDDCIVISWTKGGFLNSRGKNDRRHEYYLNLNCNNPVASPGRPGNSIMSPDGVKAKKQQELVAALNKNNERCFEDQAHIDWCRRLCTTTGLCEFSI